METTNPLAELKEALEKMDINGKTVTTELKYWYIVATHIVLVGKEVVTLSVACKQDFNVAALTFAVVKGRNVVPVCTTHNASNNVCAWVFFFAGQPTKERTSIKVSAAW